MKRFGVTLFLSVIVLCSFAQNSANSKRKIYDDIFQKGSQIQKDSIIQLIISDAKTNKDENELSYYYNVLKFLKLSTEAELVQKRALKLYPKGIMARGKEIDQFYKLESVKEKEKKYLSILKKYPMDKFPEDGIIYDYITADLSKSLVLDGQINNGLKYLNNMKERFWRAQALMPVANELLKQGDTAAALPLIQTSIDDALFYIRSDKKDNKADFAAVGYPGYVQVYSKILLAQGKNSEALKYIEEAKKIVPERSKDFAEGYAMALQKTGRDLETFNQFVILYRDGQFSFQKNLEDLYLKLNKGQLSGFEEFISQLQSDVRDKIKSHLAQQVIDKETPTFKLRNLNGEIVDSKSLLGKIVVLDFWATWCQPCRKSFPGMQKAVTKYKDDPEVVFLFIDTWEKDEKYEQNVKEFIQKNNYTFNVLFDDAKTDKEIAPQFGVSGIPAKFVIDKKGKIRFFLTGSSPYPDYILMEVSEMIEWVRKG